METTNLDTCPPSSEGRAHVRQNVLESLSGRHTNSSTFERKVSNDASYANE